MRLLLVPVFVAIASGCSGDGGGGGGGGSNTEDEPNDDAAHATDLGGAGAHEVTGHACNSDIGDDFFKATASSAGTVTLTLEWDETNPNDDLDVAILDVDEFEIVGSDAPPASISAPALAGELFYVEVACYGGFDPVPYTGTFTVP